MKKKHNNKAIFYLTYKRLLLIILWKLNGKFNYGLGSIQYKEIIIIFKVQYGKTV